MRTMRTKRKPAKRQCITACFPFSLISTELLPDIKMDIGCSSDIIPGYFPDRLLPPNLPNTQVNTSFLETGFDEEYTVLPSNTSYFFCPVCLGLPRDPVALPECGHMMCDYCLFDYVEKTGKPFLLTFSDRKATCPLCKRVFRASDVKTFDQFDAWPKAVYKSIEVHCPYSCGFSGDPFSVDYHQAYKCPLRLVSCPSAGCFVEQPEYMLAAWHYPRCTEYRVYCGKCRLPIRECTKQNHHCGTHLLATVSALQGFLRIGGIEVPPTLSFGMAGTPMLVKYGKMRVAKRVSEKIARDKEIKAMSEEEERLPWLVSKTTRQRINMSNSTSSSHSRYFEYGNEQAQGADIPNNSNDSGFTQEVEMPTATATTATSLPHRPLPTVITDFTYVPHTSMSQQISDSQRESFPGTMNLVGSPAFAIFPEH